MNVKALRDNAAMDVDSCLDHVQEFALMITAPDDEGWAYVLICRNLVRSDPTWRPMGLALDRITYHVVHWTGKPAQLYGALRKRQPNAPDSNPEPVR